MSSFYKTLHRTCFFLTSFNDSISFPAKYMRLGISLVTALSTTFATTSADEPFSNIRSKLPSFFALSADMGNLDFEISWQQLHH